MKKLSSYLIRYKVLSWKGNELLRDCNLRDSESQLKIGVVYTEIEISSKIVLK